MKRSRFTEEQIIGILNEQETGQRTADVGRRHGISEATFYKYKSEFGGMQVSDAKRLKALETENSPLKKLLAESLLDNAVLKDINAKKMLTPAVKRLAVTHACKTQGVSERRACHILGVDRSMVLYQSIRGDDALIRKRLRELANERRRRLGHLLQREGFVMNRKKLLCLYREEGLAVRRRKGRKQALGTRAPMIVRTNAGYWTLSLTL